MWIGGFGILIEKADGRVIHMGCCHGHSDDDLFAQYEAGVRFRPYDLSITSVRNLRRTVDQLLKLQLTYVIPEIACGVTWRIPERYSRQQSEQKLKSIPCVFANEAFNEDRFDVLQDLIKTGCCEFHLSDGADGDGDNFVPDLLDPKDYPIGS